MAEASARILLVDDEEAIQTLLAYPLRKEGYEVVAARDGRQALDLFADGRFDLVVLDVMMPRLDGIEVCRRLRSRSQVPIIMLTARDDEVDKVLGLEIGADDYITKPFSVREFTSRVKAALRRTRMMGSGDAEGAIAAGELTDRPLPPPGEGPRRAGAAHLRRVRDPRRARPQPGAGVRPRHAARARLGRQRLPRPAHDRRPHPPPAREDRGATRRSPSTCSRCAASATDSATRSCRWTSTSERPAGRARAPLASVRARLVLLSFAITGAAVGFVYLYVVPQLSSSLTAERLERLEQQGGRGARAAARRGRARASPSGELAELVRRERRQRRREGDDARRARRRAELRRSPTPSSRATRSPPPIRRPTGGGQRRHRPLGDRDGRRAADRRDGVPGRPAGARPERGAGLGRSCSRPRSTTSRTTSR